MIDDNAKLNGLMSQLKQKLMNEREDLVKNQKEQIGSLNELKKNQEVFKVQVKDKFKNLDDI